MWPEAGELVVLRSFHGTRYVIINHDGSPKIADTFINSGARAIVVGRKPKGTSQESFFEVMTCGTPVVKGWVNTECIWIEVLTAKGTKAFVKPRDLDYRTEDL